MASSLIMVSDRRMVTNGLVMMALTNTYTFTLVHTHKSNDENHQIRYNQIKSNPQKINGSDRLVLHTHTCKHKSNCRRSNLFLVDGKFQLKPIDMYNVVLPLRLQQTQCTITASFFSNSILRVYIMIIIGENVQHLL